MKKPAIPKPNVNHLSKETDVLDLDEESIRGMVCNPIYAGLPPFRQIVSDEAWVQAATQLINEEGPEQFLVNMLYMLRQSLEQVEQTPEDPLPQEGPKLLEAPDSKGVEEESTTPLRCYHDDFPIITVQGVSVCVAEYVFEHLENTTVTDLITHPDLVLVFQNGHTLPLYIPATGKPIFVDDDDELLDSLNGLSVIDVEWDEDEKAVVLYFGQPMREEPMTLSDEPELTISIGVHLNSIREMSCPDLAGLDTT
ncbi:MAG: hypothetical protein AAF629_37490, partial [Chloroflexota bacterium]